MHRTIDLGLNQFPSLPPKLVVGTGGHVPSLSLEVKDVLHHYFLAKFGDTAFDRGVYEYEPMLTGGPDWRFRERGIGVDTESKRNVSNELAKGFARWFSYHYLGFTYFCPFEDLIDRENEDGSVWRRARPGDLPDYVCGRDRNDPNLLEAKGRYKSVTFHTRAFVHYRDQIRRALLLDGNGSAVQVKGYISVARWATEENPRVRSRLLVEDPVTAGEPPGDEGYPAPVGLAMVLGHYAAVLDRLHLSVQADAIRLGRRIEANTGARRGIWRCVAGPLIGRQFVGGILRRTHEWNGLIMHFGGEVELRHLWRLGLDSSPFLLEPAARFFGLDERIMRAVVAAVKRGPAAAAELAVAEVPERPGSLSFLRDGTVLGPANYFEPIGVMEV